MRLRGLAERVVATGDEDASQGRGGLERMIVVGDDRSRSDGMDLKATCRVRFKVLQRARNLRHVLLCPLRLPLLWPVSTVSQATSRLDYSDHSTLDGNLAVLA